MNPRWTSLSIPALQLHKSLVQKVERLEPSQPEAHNPSHLSARMSVSFLGMRYPRAIICWLLSGETWARNWLIIQEMDLVTFFFLFMVNFKVFPIGRAYKYWQSEEGKCFYFQMGKCHLPFFSFLLNSSVGKKLLIHSELCQLFMGPGLCRLGSGGRYPK